MIYAGTGHRPHKLGGYDVNVRNRTVALAESWLSDSDAHVVISGMALGWDTGLAIAALRLGIDVWAYVPCDSFQARWPLESRRRFDKILSRVKRIEFVHDGPYPGPHCLQDRNEMMADDCEKFIALWDGSPGGTANCLEYASQIGRKWLNLWPVWKRLNAA